MTTHKMPPRRRLDLASLALTLVGVASGTLSCWLVIALEYNALIVIPSIVAVALGSTHLVTIEAPRR